MIQGMAEAHARQIEEVRCGGPFSSVDDFTGRTGLGRSVTTRLAKAGAFASLGLDRRGALWHALAQGQRELPLFDRGLRETRQTKNRRGRETHQPEGEPNRKGRETHRPESEHPKVRAAHRSDTEKPANKETVRCTHPTNVELPKMSAAEEVLADYRTT
ncbi:MAG: hypothetical protein GTO03_08885, partial [Planctomycetales bacterium]|nr:hypothetical protein [Planctomycetales bacterium]